MALPTEYCLDGKKNLTQYVNKKQKVTSINSNNLFKLAYNATFQIRMSMINFVNVYDRPGGGANKSTNHVLHKI